mmetsp:Transcript_19768/g.48569  ORF Transcript_19768/g.48569 Transcript_19768/m.48569 type:complete len:291 (-) Transcript_19768:168-1040(-)
MMNTISSAFAANDQLTNLDPATYKYNIVLINQALGQLFVRLAQSSFDYDQYKVFCTLRTYAKIKQPREWSYFVTFREEEQESGTLTDPVVLMNKAVKKYNRCNQFTGEFQASSSSLEEIVRSMLTTMENKQKRLAASKPIKDAKDSKPDNAKKPKLLEDENKKKAPPFLTHTRKSAKNGGKPYEEDDTKTWNKNKYYFHVCPNHKGGKRWFQHTCGSCIACNKWKKKQCNNDDGSSVPKASAISEWTCERKDHMEALLSRAYDLAKAHKNAAATQAYIAKAWTILREERR